MIAAVRFASHIGAPMTMMLNINAAHIQRMTTSNSFDVGHPWDVMQGVLELLRKWIIGRGLPWACVWVREYTGGRNRHTGEHWHIALHLPPRHRQELAAQVAIWTDEGVGSNDHKETCIARSITGAWYLSKRNDNAGLYLGKATPTTRIKYGKRVPNELRVTGRKGGEGRIEGKRFGISRPIGDTAQRRQGWQ